ncbi:MAG: alpha/beta hydrolase [Acetobacteraceae bacterium]|nr:alpha/beta hydrolase [Acetobacteraceae bacterium]
MRRLVLKTLRRLAVVAVVAAVATLGLRLWQIESGAPLELWHKVLPPELSAAEIDHTDWQGYLAAEERAFATVEAEVVQKLTPDERAPFNRYDPASPVHPGRFAQDFNRSFVLEPDGPPRGAVVLLHGLTDAPYSMRHVGALYRDHGFVAIVPRLPAHGTVPAALAAVDWPDWMAATRLALREARRRAGPGAPIHLVGFSNGGALALKHALDALDDPALVRPDRLVLISPMVGITEFARFAGIAGWPAWLPRFAKAAWLGVVPEFNPFKFNSFPVNGATQSWRVTQALQEQIRRHTRGGTIAGLPPALTFQSVLDFTVSTRAIIDALYARLPANGSALVLFDLNRAAKLGPLLRPRLDTQLARVLPPPPRAFSVTVIANAAPGQAAAVARTTQAGSAETSEQLLPHSFQPEVFSLSHVALPFPETDGLYGSNPDPAEDFGIQFGTIAARGERGALIVALDALLRQSSNPFFPYMLERIAELIPPR